jgi:hypothetical protein
MIFNPGRVLPRDMDTRQWGEFLSRLLREISVDIPAIKVSDESVASSAALQNDNDLFAAVKADTRYAFEMYLYVYSAGTGGFRQNWSLPTGTVGTAQVVYNSSSTPSSFRRSMSGAAADLTLIAGGATEWVMHWVGEWLVGSVDGVIQLRWSQETSNASATSVGQGSWLRLIEMR